MVVWALSLVGPDSNGTQRCWRVFSDKFILRRAFALPCSRSQQCTPSVAMARPPLVCAGLVLLKGKSSACLVGPMVGFGCFKGGAFRVGRGACWSRGLLRRAFRVGGGGGCLDGVCSAPHGAAERGPFALLPRVAKALSLRQRGLPGSSGKRRGGAGGLLFAFVWAWWWWEAAPQAWRRRRTRFSKPPGAVEHILASPRDASHIQ
jgi:hypothetical protein